jgi:hypothetical protein
MAALLTGSGACACSSPPIALELPPTTLAGDRVLVTVADGVVDAQWLETSAPLPTFTLPADGAIELTVLELGATRAALELADVAPTFAPPGRARGLARAPNIRSARIDAEGASAWEARAALDGPLSTLAAPFAVEPCFPLAMIERLPETSTEGVALLAQDATTTWLASGSRWWTLFADERPPPRRWPRPSGRWSSVPTRARAAARTSSSASAPTAAAEHSSSGASAEASRRSSVSSPNRCARSRTSRSRSRRRRPAPSSGSPAGACSSASINLRRGPRGGSR